MLDNVTFTRASEAVHLPDDWLETDVGELSEDDKATLLRLSEALTIV